MLYCHGSCGAFWHDNQKGCQPEDADVYCRLATCNELAYAERFDVIDVQPLPGFACAGRGVNYGNWMGQVDVHFTENMRETHGFGKSVANVKCKITGKIVFFFPNIKFYISILQHGFNLGTKYSSLAC